MNSPDLGSGKEPPYTVGQFTEARQILRTASPNRTLRQSAGDLILSPLGPRKAAC
jgi:hypothetical protein